jgi:hypothetical protein
LCSSVVLELSDKSSAIIPLEDAIAVHFAILEFAIVFPFFVMVDQASGSMLLIINKLTLKHVVFTVVLSFTLHNIVIEIA